MNPIPESWSGWNIGRVPLFGHRPSRNGAPDQLDVPWIQASFDKQNIHATVLLVDSHNATVTYRHEASGQRFKAELSNLGGSVTVGIGVPL